MVTIQGQEPVPRDTNSRWEILSRPAGKCGHNSSYKNTSQAGEVPYPIKFLLYKHKAVTPILRTHIKTRVYSLCMQSQHWGDRHLGLTGQPSLFDEPQVPLRDPISKYKVNIS